MSHKRMKHSFDFILAAAIRWKRATYMVAESIPDQDIRKQYKLSQMTTKDDLDAYIMKRFGIDPCDARSISNTITERNIKVRNFPIDINEFCTEPFYELYCS